MKMRNNMVSIVIPNYNGIEFIANCLQSLQNQSFENYEIIVVDNASSDRSTMYIKEKFPEVKLIELDKNYGFSKAVNEGIKQSASKYVILLNNDTTVDEYFVEELVKVMEESKQIFSCQAKMLQMYDSSRIDDAGDYYCSLGWAFARGKGKSSLLYQENAKIFAACAGAAIYRREVFDQIGYFDEAHFAYLEDIDIGYRARIHGYKNRYAAKSVVYHAGSGSSGSRYNEFKVDLASRNSIFLIYKNMPFLQILLNLPFLLIGFIIKIMFFSKKGFGKTYLLGLKKGIQMAIKLEKVEFHIKNMGNYASIQFELWINTIRRFVY
ncbi:glycosyltransferase family 2 protein [Candidatus Galacturonibacter soehngenii]|uniref:Glycosyltransferase family 2 protein n=1 Tax=Candidatus Galacturonatibacter soehngenii TaxID=2307010 RepID=A0A7V7QKE6_9FIRM|nr:glycosyltransferase family 2 protein [Candidatus Galacturonibacter soehngenii]KAB1438212.1 glycosyltransferase family 2 protein [Candidatus Galacturonibacter soehngenii]